MLAVWKLPVGVNLALNALRALVIFDRNGLLEPTQPGSGISAISVLPEASERIRW